MIAILSRWFKKADSSPQTLALDTKPLSAPLTLPQRVQQAISGGAKEKRAARETLAQQLASGELSLSDLETQCADIPTLMNLCGRHMPSLMQLFKTPLTEEQLVQLALDGDSSTLRQLAASRLKSREALETLLKSAKGGDKTVYRLAKDGLAQFKAQDQADELMRQAVAQDALDAERLLKRPCDERFQHRYQQLSHQLQTALQDTQAKIIAHDEIKRLQLALTQCEAKLTALAQQQREAAQAALEQASELASLQAAPEKITRIAETWLATSHWDAERITAADAALAAFDAQPSEALTHGPLSAQADAALVARKQARLAAETLAKALADSALPTRLAALTQADAAQAQSAREALSELIEMAEALPGLQSSPLEDAKIQLGDWWAQQQAAKTSRVEREQQIAELLRRCRRALDAGQWRSARGLHKKLSALCADTLPLPAGLEKAVGELDARILQVGDWHQFAVTPKKTALIEAMTALIGAPLEPEHLADKIHALQEHWRELATGSLTEGEDPLWQAFQTQADLAYAPCKAHFDAQAHLRDQNARAREQILADLARYESAYNWDNAVWKDVEALLKTTRASWKSLWPVPRALQTALQERFDTQMAKLEAPLFAAYEKAKQQKMALIAQAEKAAQLSDSKIAADTIKQLQQQWKACDRAAYKDEQRLWDSFRALCDSVFASRQAAWQAAQSLRQQTQAQVQQVTASLAALIDNGTLTDDSLSSLQADYEALADVPKTEAEAWHKMWGRAKAALQQRQASAKVAARRGAFSLNLDLSALEIAGASSQQTNAIQEALTGLEPQLPPAWINVLKTRLAALTASGSPAATDEVLRKLCIRAEISCSQETPETDKALRMAMQVDALQNRFGQKSAVDFDLLACEWLSQGAQSAAALNALQPRFLRCFAQ